MGRTIVNSRTLFKIFERNNVTSIRYFIYGKMTCVPHGNGYRHSQMIIKVKQNILINYQKHLTSLLGNLYISLHLLPCICQYYLFLLNELKYTVSINTNICILELMLA